MPVPQRAYLSEVLTESSRGQITLRIFLLRWVLRDDAQTLPLEQLEALAVGEAFSAGGPQIAKASP